MVFVVVAGVTIGIPLTVIWLMAPFLEEVPTRGMVRIQIR
jgi:hypothetical protein